MEKELVISTIDGDGNELEISREEAVKYIGKVKVNNAIELAKMGCASVVDVPDDSDITGIGFIYKDPKIEIYIVVKDTCYDCDSERDIKAFRNKQEAEAHFKKISSSYRKAADEDGWVIGIDSESDFEAYEEGYEVQNHCYFNIITQKV